MKINKVLIPVAILLVTAISLYSLITTNMKNLNEYNQTLFYACDYASQGIVDDAVKYYDKAIKLNCNAETYIEYVNVYVNNGFSKKALRLAEQMVKDIKDSPQAYECLLDRYIDLKMYEDCFQLDDEVKSKRLRSDGFAEKMANIEYTYATDYQMYTDVNAFSGGFASVKSDDLYGVIDETGKRILNKSYVSAGHFSYFTNKKNKDDSGYVMPVCTKEGKWMYISSKGNKKIEMDENVKYEHLGLYVDNSLTAVSVEGKYAYYNSDFEKVLGDYEYGSTFNCGVAAVRTGENEWYIINEQGEKINSTPYADVVLDSKEIAFRNDRAFVMKDGNYYLIDTSCNEIGKNKFTDAKPFYNTNRNDKNNNDPILAAVCSDGKWGFVDTDGNYIINPSYQDAHSFSSSFAAVNQNGQWGFIQSDGTVVIDCSFDDVGDFNSKGCVFTMKKSRWTLIKLYKYNH